MINIKSALAFALIGISLVFTGACQSSSATIWDPTGIWNVSFVLTIELSDSTDIDSWTEPLTLSGSTRSGTVSGFTWDATFSPQDGTYTVSGDHGITIRFDFRVGSIDRIITLTGSTSESNLNFMGGSGTWEVGGNTHSVTFTATKATNLQ